MRESCRRDQRYPCQAWQIPYARYGRRRFRMHSTVVMSDRCSTFDCLLSSRVFTTLASVFSIYPSLCGSKNTRNRLLYTHRTYVLRSLIFHAISPLHLQCSWHRPSEHILVDWCPSLSCWPLAMLVYTWTAAEWAVTFDGSHTFEQATVRIDRALFSKSWLYDDWLM